MATIREQVMEFHKAMGQPILDKPTVPTDDRMKLRLRLIAEEFFETMEAVGFNCFEIKDMLMNKIDYAESFNVDFPELLDGLADLDYVIEGCRLELGCNGELIAAEVHRSNMSKVGGEKRADGKILKPKTFTKPDIAGELKKQGWTG